MAAEGGKKKNDAMVPIMLLAGGLLLLLLFGGCGSISLPVSGPGWYRGSGNGGSHPSHPGCDPRYYDCRGHWDGNGHWVRDPGADEHDRRHHLHHHRPVPTDDPDGGDGGR